MRRVYYYLYKDINVRIPGRMTMFANVTALLGWN
jgi:hypothetical protein